MAPPWEADEPERAIADYIARVFHGIRPLCVLPLHDAKVSIGHDTHHRAAAGLPVRAARLGGLGARVRRPERLHPPHVHLRARARPAAAVGALRPRRHRVPAACSRPPRARASTRTRTSSWCGRPSRTSLARGLQQLAREDPPPGSKVVRGHSDVIIGWAVSDNEFFERVEDIVTFRTTRGPLSLPEYLDQSGGGALLRHARAGLASGAGARRGPRRARHRRLVVQRHAVPGEVRPAPSRRQPRAARRRVAAAVAAGRRRRSSRRCWSITASRGAGGRWRRSSRRRRRR